jgi:hypothetical protein
LEIATIERRLPEHGILVGKGIIDHRSRNEIADRGPAQNVVWPGSHG